MSGGLRRRGRGVYMRGGRKKGKREREHDRERKEQGIEVGIGSM